MPVHRGGLVQPVADVDHDLLTPLRPQRGPQVATLEAAGAGRGRAPEVALTLSGRELEHPAPLRVGLGRRQRRDLQGPVEGDPSRGVHPLGQQDDEEAAPGGSWPTAARRVLGGTVGEADVCWP
ncbi:hypothetical protein LVO85_01570 [Ornithinimicrobium sp. EGI L100131]|nr:hypothetical protein [Ornithinimicrobium sediminis]